jgi:hypothetical protein
MASSKFDFSLGSLVGGSEAEQRAANSVASGVEVAAGAFLTAYGQGKMPAYQSVMGIDTALIAGLVLSSAGLFDKSGKWGGHVSSVGHGALATYATKLGMSLSTPSSAAPKGLGYGQPAFAVPANEGAWARR